MIVLTAADNSLVRDSVEEVLPQPERQRASLAVPSVVCQGEQGPVVRRHGYRAAVRATGACYDSGGRTCHSLRSQALHLHPDDKAIMYNIAMIEQKAAELLLSVAPAKRSLKELQRAIEHATHAQKFVLCHY